MSTDFDKEGVWTCLGYEFSSSPIYCCEAIGEGLKECDIKLLRRPIKACNQIILGPIQEGVYIHSRTGIRLSGICLGVA